MHKDEHFIGYTPRYIVLPKSYAVWDTQTNCWVSDTENSEQSIAQESAYKFNEWNKNAENNNTL